MSRTILRLFLLYLRYSIRKGFSITPIDLITAVWYNYPDCMSWGEMDMIPSNPDDKTNLPKAEKHELSFYNKEELDKLFEVFKASKR